MKITRTEAGAIPVYKDGDRDPTEWEVLAEQAFADEFDAEIAGLSKHEGGGHDQKTHGNWARGLRATPGRLASALGEDALTPAMSQAVEHATDQARLWIDNDSDLYFTVQELAESGALDPGELERQFGQLINDASINPDMVDWVTLATEATGIDFADVPLDMEITAGPRDHTPGPYDDASWADAEARGYEVEVKGKKMVVLDYEDPHFGMRGSEKPKEFAHALFDTYITLDDGSVVEAFVTRAHAGYGDIEVHGQVILRATNGNIEVIGGFERNLSPGTGTVEMQHFWIGSSLQGRGIGSTLVAHWEDQFDRSGEFSNMEVFAVSNPGTSNGAYTWMRQGYDFVQSDYGPSESHTLWDRFVDMAEVGDVGVDSMDVSWASGPQDLLTLAEDVGVGGEFVGFLKGDYGMVEWHGIKPVERLPSANDITHQGAPRDGDGDGIVDEGEITERFVGTA